MSNLLPCTHLLVKVNGYYVTGVYLRKVKDEQGNELSHYEPVITDIMYNSFAIDNRFTIETLNLDIPFEQRKLLPNDGWMTVPAETLVQFILQVQAYKDKSRV